MLKGINHSIIEVNDTGNEYYERAILIIKPEYSSVERSILEYEARQLLKELDAPSAFRLKKKKLSPVIAAAIISMLGLAAAVIISILF